MASSKAEFDFSDRRVLVVGGSRGIGKAVVQGFEGAGAIVTYAARSPMVDDSTAQFIPTDIHSEDAVLDLFSRIDEAGGLDVMINLAAINFAKKIEDIETSEWDDVLSVNLRAAFIICREAAKRMKSCGQGKIINVSSIAGRHRSPVAGVHYVSSKSGIIGLSKQLAFELGPYGVNVNVVCPSQTMTEMLETAMTPEEREALANTIPLRRIATTKEQVGPIMFLCSDAASYITGAVIDINGGQI